MRGSGFRAWRVSGLGLRDLGFRVRDEDLGLKLKGGFLVGRPSPELPCGVYYARVSKWGGGERDGLGQTQEVIWNSFAACGSKSRAPKNNTPQKRLYCYSGM